MNKKQRNTSIKDLESYFMNNLGIKSKEEVNNWYIKAMTNQYRIDKLSETAEWLFMQDRNRPIVICGDYDADGFTSISILKLTLQRLGFTNVIYDIPYRFTEGFGINLRMISTIPNDAIVITCDNGVAQVSVINELINRNNDVIIIDHHEPHVSESGDIVLPNANFIIDPNAIANSADFNGYCGAGLCYRFSQALLSYGNNIDDDKIFLKKMCSIAAIGTIADLMNIREENYYIIRQGLTYLKDQSTTTVGAYALISAFDLNNNLTSTDIAFSIAPALNSASRIDENNAKLAVDLLTWEDDYPTALYNANILLELNKERKALKKEGLSKVNKILEEHPELIQVPLVLYVPNLKEGIVGIIAGDLASRFKVPCFVLTDAIMPGFIKGSARTYGNYDIKANLDNIQNLLYIYGGHKEAAGLTLTKENFDNLRNSLIQNVDNYEVDETLYYDIELDANDIPAFLKEMSMYEPFGQGNPKPICKVNHFICDEPFFKNSLAKFKCKNVRNLNAVNFDSLGNEILADESHTFYGTLSYNYFRNNVSCQIEYIDFD